MYKVIEISKTRFGIMDDETAKVIMTSLDKESLEERCRKWNELSKTK